MAGKEYHIEVNVCFYDNLLFINIDKNHVADIQHR